MKYVIKAPAEGIRASVQLPSSKSISNRVLIMNALGYSPYEIRNLSESDDTGVLRQALESEGHDFDIGAAGTAMRFLAAYLSKIAGEWTLTGTERMKNRPIKLLVEALNSLGARIEYMEKEGFPPLRIFGSALRGGEVSLSGRVSSQFISAILMVAPYMERGLILHLKGKVISRPYINLTVQLMKQFGIYVKWSGQTIEIPPGEYKPAPFHVEPDWSAASYWYTIMALSKDAEIELPGLLEGSLQGDAAGARLFARLGVATEFTERGVKLSHNGIVYKRLDYNFINQPDLAQTFVVACVLLDTRFRFTGLGSLKIKETDRIAALVKELRKMGYVLEVKSTNTIEWNGERCEPAINPVIKTYEDHRMAMAFAPFALVIPKGIEISKPEVVSKSYPRFWEDLKAAGFQIMEN